MAGTKFNLAALARETERRFAERRAELEAAAKEAHETTRQDLLDQWQGTAEKRVLELARRIRSKTETVGRDDLEGFHIGYAPSRGAAEAMQERADKALVWHDREAERVLGYVRALQPDEVGAVVLTTPDLRRIGWPADV